MTRSKPIARTSQTQRRRISEYSRVKRNWSKTVPMVCARCHMKGDYYSLTVHHTRGTVGALRNMTELWKLLCLPCHIWVGENPDLAREAGLLCEKGLWNTLPKPEQEAV